MEIEKKIRLVELLTDGVKNKKFKVGISTVGVNAYSIHINWRLVFVIKNVCSLESGIKSDTIVGRYALKNGYELYADSTVRITVYNNDSIHELLEILYKECSDAVSDLNSVDFILDELKIALM